MTPPVVGATPSTVSVVGGEVDYNFQGAWYEFNGVNDNGAPKVGKLLSATDTFESGKQYMAAVRITLSENLVFSSDFAGYINGNKAAFMGDASPSSNGVVIWAAYTPYEKDYYIDLTTVTPIEGEEIPGNPLVALNEYIPTRGSALARWYDEHGELIEGGKFVGGKVYYVTYILRSKPNSKLPSIAQTEFRVNGETPDNVELYQASSGDSYIYKITHAVHCVDKIEFYFTEGSYPEANASMTVDIERIVEQSDDLLTAYFDDDYSVQWYRDGYELDGANDLSLSFEIKDTLYTYYCVLTVGDTVLKSYEFVVTKHVHKYTGEYTYDSKNHEIACNDPNCDDYSGSVITEPHSLNADGNCLICGYVTAMLGDVNDDKKVDSVDYLLVKRACFKTYELDASQFVRADVNGDEKLDSTDYLLVKRIAFGTYKV